MEKQPMPGKGNMYVSPVVAVRLHDKLEDYPNERKFILARLFERNAEGIRTYGTMLKTENGRDALIDAIDEALDMCQYIMQARLEADGRTYTRISLDDVFDMAVDILLKLVEEYNNRGQTIVSCSENRTI